MTKRKTVLIGAIVAAVAGSWIVACSSGSNDNPTPPGTTPVATPPYPACAQLDPGSFTSTGSYVEPATTSCTPAGMPAAGALDSHCAGVPPQPVNGASCNSMDAGAAPSGDAGTSGGDAGTPPAPGPCDENGSDGAYGTTMSGNEGDDDDCKYHVSYTVSPICENNGTYFVVKASYLAGSMGPVTGASTVAELCLNDTHPAPVVDGRPPAGHQQVVEGPPGTYTIGPVVFDAPGNWTVRFHFNEFCCDIAPDSPHGHAAFLVTVP